jgi:hypothetical protein
MFSTGEAAPRIEARKTARVSLGKLYLSVKKEDVMNVEVTSIYGQAFVMPQIARSAGWPARLVVLCVRSQVFLMANCFLQWMLVYSLMKEEQVMDKFAGQMWMCNFAAIKEGCPEADGCIGPGGTRITPSRLYSFAQWNMRKFVKTALKDVFPDRSDLIEEKVDAGEYGLESQHCRLLCTFLFIVAVTQELRSSIELIRLLWSVPSEEQSWVVEDPDTCEVKLKISGIPRAWKFANVILVVVPKFMLWQFICRTGMIFLLETASIQNTIVNSTALTFILNIDELLFEVFATAQTKHMLRTIEGYPIGKQSETEISDEKIAEWPDEGIIDASEVNVWFSRASVPWYVLVSVGIWVYFVWVYYTTHCHLSPDGTLVSNPMYLPKSTSFSHLSAFLPQVFPVASVDTPYWTYKEHIEN